MYEVGSKKDTIENFQELIRSNKTKVLRNLFFSSALRSPMSCCLWWRARTHAEEGLLKASYAQIKQSLLVRYKNESSKEDPPSQR